MRAVNTAQAQPLIDRLQRDLSWIRRFASGIAITGLSLSLVCSGEAKAISVTLEKIVDTNTPIPGGTGNFEGFSAPSLDNGNVAFSGSAGFEFNQSGIYTNIGGKLNVVADTNTPIPGGTGNFENFGDLSLDNENVAFMSTDFDQQKEGIYTNISDTLSLVVDTNTPLSGDIDTFDIFYGYSLDNGDVAFTIADVNSNQEILPFGIYTNIDGKLNVIADKKTPIPDGTDNFERFSAPSLDNGDVAFSGFNFEFTEAGVYTSVGGELDVIADISTSVPGGIGNFEGFGDPSLNNGNVAFLGIGFDQQASIEQQGIYTSIDAVLNVVADTNTPIPGGTGTFGPFFYDALSLDNGNLAFVGNTDSSQQGNFEVTGIYTNIGGVLTKVIAEGDILDGKRVSNVSFGREGLSGKQIAFTAHFTDSSGTDFSGGIYIATVPEPASVLGTLAFGAFGISSLLKRKLKKQKSS